MAHCDNCHFEVPGDHFLGRRCPLCREPEADPRARSTDRAGVGQRFTESSPRWSPASGLAARSARARVSPFDQELVGVPSAGVRHPRRTTASRLGVVEGVVIASQGPSHIPGSRNPWKLMSALLATLAFLPLVLALWACALTVRLALAFLGLGWLGGGRDGRSLIDEIILFHLFGAAARPSEPVPVYDYIIDTGTGHRAARQEGEFVDGRIFVGNSVRLEGASRGGTLLIREGWNDTYGTRLTRPRDGWPMVALLLGVLLAAECGFALTRSPSIQPAVLRWESELRR